MRRHLSSHTLSSISQKGAEWRFNNKQVPQLKDQYYSIDKWIMSEQVRGSGRWRRLAWVDVSWRVLAWVGVGWRGWAWVGRLWAVGSASWLTFEYGNRMYNFLRKVGYARHGLLRKLAQVLDHYCRGERLACA